MSSELIKHVTDASFGTDVLKDRGGEEKDEHEASPDELVRRSRRGGW